MQAGVGLLVMDVMPIYMIMPRYSRNYSLFYQLLDSNLFTHRNTYAILREATSETYGPRVYLPSYNFPINLLFLLRYLGFPGQLDLFILQWEEVPGSGFDLTVLDPSDRRGTNTYVSLLLRIKR